MTDVSSITIYDDDNLIGAAILNAAQVTVQIPGIQGGKGARGSEGAQGPSGEMLVLSGAADTYALLPVTLTDYDYGQIWMTNDTGKIYFWDGSQFPPEADGPAIRGPSGPDGTPGQIRFTGLGDPGTIIGASPNDTYLDTQTGNVWTLF